MKRAVNIIIMGPPGAGKSTQAKAIAARYDLASLSTGDMVRNEIKKGGELGEELRQIVARGDMAPESLMYRLVESSVSDIPKSQGFILDGFPRDEKQAIWFDDFLQSQGRKIDTAVEIAVDDENVVKRICGRFSCKECDAGYHKDFKQPKEENECDDCGAVDSFHKRVDDSEDVVRNRVKIYKELTAGVLALYKKTGRLVTVNGNGDADMIEKDIKTLLDKKLSLAKYKDFKKRGF